MHLAGLDEFLDTAFGAAANRARHVESRGVRGCAGSGPAAERNFFSFEFFDPIFEGRVHGGGDDGEAVFGVAIEIFRESGKFAHDSDQILLHLEEALASEFVGGGGAGEAERGVQFVNGAACFDARMRFRDAAIVHQPGGA